jgi:magnesium-transporting ATPase (P-type)
LICAVGTNTRSGMAEEKLNIEEEETPLQAKLETIANEIGKVGVYVAILTFIVMTIKLVIRTALDDANVRLINLTKFRILLLLRLLNQSSTSSSLPSLSLS